MCLPLLASAQLKSDTHGCVTLAVYPWERLWRALREYHTYLSPQKDPLGRLQQPPEAQGQPIPGITGQSWSPGKSSWPAVCFVRVIVIQNISFQLSFCVHSNVCSLLAFSVCISTILVIKWIVVWTLSNVGVSSIRLESRKIIRMEDCWVARSDCARIKNMTLV